MQRARCYLLGETAVTLELELPVTLESQQWIWGLTQCLSRHEEVVDAIPGMNNIIVVFHHPQEIAWGAIDRLQYWWEESLMLEPEPRSLAIPVVYGGEAGLGLGVVAQRDDLSGKQVVELHASVEYLVWFIGLQPGFPYLGGLSPALTIPRRAEPRIRVSAGLVGIGGARTGIYPLAMPGGWQLLGRTALTLLNPARKEPALLRAGDKICFMPQKERVCQP